MLVLLLWVVYMAVLRWIVKKLSVVVDLNVSVSTVGCINARHPVNCI